MSLRSPKSIGSLGLALLHQWKPETLFVIVTAYMDESGTHSGAEHITLGGWVARWGQWDVFDPKWNALLKRYGLTYFHSKEMHHNEKEFRGWSDDKKLKFMTEAAIVAQRHTMLGFTFMLRYEDYEQHYKAGHTAQQLPLDSPYGVSFRACLSVIPALVKDDLQKRKNVDLYFVLESGCKNSGDALRIFNLAKKWGVPEISPILKAISLGDKKDYPGLQAADVNANMAFRHEGKPDTEFGPMPEELSVRALHKAADGPPVLRCQVTPKILAKFKKALLARHGKKLLAEK